MEQRSKEWLDFRRQGIGASDSNIIMGHGFNRSVHDLWLDKIGLGKEVEVNEKMKRGITLEPIAREWASKEFGVNFDPVVRNHRTIPYMFASSDGYHAESNLLIEIKTCEKLHERVPEYYMPQLHHLMETFDVKMIMYISYDGATGKIIEVKKDDLYTDKILEAEKDFWYKVENFIEPESDFKYRTDDIWMNKACGYLHAKKQMEYWENQVESWRKNILEEAQEDTKGCGLTVRKKVKKGGIDYATILDKYKIEEIEKYRKNPIEYWEVREAK